MGFDPRFDVMGIDRWVLAHIEAHAFVEPALLLKWHPVRMEITVPAVGTLVDYAVGGVWLVPDTAQPRGQSQ